MRDPLRVVVNGASGRMGRRLTEIIRQDPRFETAALVDCSVSDGIVGPEGLPASLARADALIDFSAPEAAAAAVELSAQAGKPAVVGVTGFDEGQMVRIKAAARRGAVFLSPNFSPGTRVLDILARTAAGLLADYEVCISETHHALKKDAPSGTALRLADAVALVRDGRRPPMISQRIGDIVGEHTFTLAGPCERLEITHRAHSRDLFAVGALRAALWLVGRKPGLYGMEDMIPSL